MKGKGVARRTMGSRTESSVGSWKETWLPTLLTLEALSLRERGILKDEKEVVVVSLLFWTVETEKTEDVCKESRKRKGDLESFRKGKIERV